MAMEVQEVLGGSIRVIPLILDDEGERELSPHLAKYQWVDFRTGYDDALQHLLEALQPFRAERPIAPAEKKPKGYVFLSYAEEDASFVDDLKAFLGTRGYAYWDYRESDRDYHQDLYLGGRCAGVFTASQRSRTHARDRRTSVH